MQSNNGAKYVAGELVYDTRREDAREYVGIALATADGTVLLHTVRSLTSEFVEDVPASELEPLILEDESSEVEEEFSPEECERALEQLFLEAHPGMADDVRQCFTLADLEWR